MVCLTTLASAAFPVTSWANDFPYGARVTTQTATVRSGPGVEFYPTDRLPLETRVEVYRHDDEWAAIRPPSGSFSWVPAAAIELTEDTSRGQVAYDGIRTRIGSRLSEQRSAEYVELKADEEVIVLARRTLDEDGKPTRWYQIEPPAGEFRWVQLTSLERLPNPLLRSNLDSHDGPVSQSDETVDATSADANEVELVQFVEEAAPSLLVTDGDTDFAPPKDEANAEALDAEPFNRASPTTQTPTAAKSLQPSKEDSTWKLENSPPGNSVEAQPLGFAAESILGGSESPRRSLAQVDPALLQQELAKINLELTRQILQDPNTWRLRDLRARTQTVIDLCATKALREQAQDLLSRITQFDDIKRRHADLTQGVADGFLSRSDLGGIASSSAFEIGDNPLGLRPLTMPPPTPQSQTPGSAYDGSGWLMPVVTRQVGVPRYALTDDHGNILQFVSPRPGLNLRNYEKRRIGIIGQKGFVPRYNKPHLTAERVISLDRVRF